MSDQLNLFPAEWEFDFSNSLRIKPPSCSQCAECDELVHRDDVVIRQFYVGTIVDVEHFCSEGCYHKFYVDRLRQVGM